jgi:hypothetical protein
LCLFAPLLTLVAVCPVAPTAGASELEIQRFLALLNHSSDFVSDCLRKLLSTREFDAVEDNNPRGLIQGCG